MRSVIGAFDNSRGSGNAVALADAYYIDPRLDVEKRRMVGKPVMIEDCSIV